MGTCNPNIKRCLCCDFDGRCCHNKRRKLPTVLLCNIIGGPDAPKIIPCTFDSVTGTWVGSFHSVCGQDLIVQIECSGDCFLAIFCCVPNIFGCCEVMFCAISDLFTCDCDPVHTKDRQVACSINPQAGCLEGCTHIVWTIEITE